MLFYIIICLNYRCKIPGLDNDTYAVKGKWHEELLNRTIPLSDDPTLTYDQCHIYDTNDVPVDENDRPTNASLIKCKEWVYDKSVFYETFTSKVSYVLV